MEKQTNSTSDRSRSVPKLRFPEFNGEWENRKLGEVLEFKNGINAAKEQYGSGYKFINVLDILNNDFITHEKIIGSVNVDEELFNKFSVKYGDILFQRSSETREEVGTASVYLDENKSATFGGFVIRGKKIGEYEPVFLNRLLKTDLSREQITSKSGGSTRYNVGQEILASVSLPFPTLPEQASIASFFSVLDKKIAELKQKKILLEQYKKGVMQKIFSQELRFKDVDGNEFPKWEKKKLEECCDYKNGGSFENRLSEYGEYYLITLNSLDINGKLKNEHKRVDNTDNSLQKGDLVMVLSDVAHGNFLGLTDIIPGDNYVLNQRMGALKPIIEINTVFLKTFINLRQKYFKLKGQGSSQQNLSKGDICNFEILIPCLAEQTKIANFLSGLDEKIYRTENQIKQTQQYKKGLLQNMFV
ncbi:MAG: restriction endonuclease subunit S [Mariniphaga sp.]